MSHPVKHTILEFPLWQRCPSMASGPELMIMQFRGVSSTHSGQAAWVPLWICHWTTLGKSPNLSEPLLPHP